MAQTPSRPNRDGSRRSDRAGASQMENRRNSDRVRTDPARRQGTSGGSRRRRRKKVNGLVRFLVALVAVLILSLGLVVFRFARTNSEAKKAQAAMLESAASAVITPTPAPTKQGEMITGTYYDPNTAGLTFSETEGAGEEPESDNTASSAPAQPEKTPEPETAGKEETVYIKSSSVNVRSAAGTDSTILGQVNYGRSITRFGTEGDWSVVDYNGSKAYIKSEFLTTEEIKTLVKTDWNLEELDNTAVGFGYSSANLDENNVPTDWEWYESKWGQFNVDWIQDTSSKTIYLTMDEGFGNDNTITILDTLAEKGVPVLFFLTKNFVDDRPELVQRMLDEGHQLGNHSRSHPNMPQLGIEGETEQIQSMQDLIRDKYGYTMKFFRFPEGVYSSQSLGLVNNMGLKVVFWSYAYGDYDEANQPDVGESLEKALNRLHPGAIYLLHASSDTNMKMLGDFIDGARARGFEFGVYPAD